MRREGLKDLRDEYDIQHTLVFFVKNGKALLARKRRKIGKGRWNGYGGEVEVDDESIEACAVREVRKESGGVVTPMESLQKVAICYMTNIKDDGSEFVCKVHVFISTVWFGEFKATDEMGVPSWFSFGNLPFPEMMAADQIWLFYIFSYKKVYVFAKMRKNQSEIVDFVNVIPVDYFV